MKKTALLGIIGLVAGVASTYGQGYITLDNYTSGLNTLPITYGAGVPANGVGGALGSGPLSGVWSVGLYFAGATTSAGVGLVEAAGTGIPSAPLVLATGSGSSGTFASQNAVGSPGFYGIQAAFNTGSTTFTYATLEVVAYFGSSYADATYRGHSAAFTMPTVAATSPTAIYTGDYSQPFTVNPVPEPSTLAMAGLGGFGMLMALRRKKA